MLVVLVYLINSFVVSYVSILRSTSDNMRPEVVNIRPDCFAIGVQSLAPNSLE